MTMPSDEIVDYTVEVHNEGANGFWAEVLDLPGCFASGETMDELWEAVAEAVSLYLSTPEQQSKVTIEKIEPDITHREVIETHRVVVAV